MEGSMGRKVAWLLSIVVLVGTGVMGVRNGVVELPDAATALQKSVTVGVLLYGILGLVAGIGLAARRPWSRWAALLWGVVVTYVATAAVIAYGGADASTGAALTGGAATALIAAGVAWTARRTTTAPTVAGGADSPGGAAG
jgi:hypothetical protein